MHPYLARALRYALSKIAALWDLVTLRDILVRRARERSSAKGDRMSLRIGFTWPLRANEEDSSIP